MKLLCLILSLFISLSSFAQSDFKISDTLKLNEINKSEAFENTLEWVALNFGSANQVIQYQNKERGKIILKGMLKDEYRTEFTLSIIFLDGTWSYSLSNIKSLEYTYDYLKGDSDCYTKQCRTNMKKWKDSISEKFVSLVGKLSESFAKK
jgi:hypothetical protein